MPTPIPFSSSGPASSTTRLAAARRCAVGPIKDLSRSRNLLEPCRQVHGFAGGERGVRVLDDELAGFDADPCFEPELFDRMPDQERCPGGALRVVFVGLRHAKLGENNVTRELLDDATVQRDAVRDLLEELIHAAAHDLRILSR